MGGEQAVQLKNVTVCYGGQRNVIDDLSYEVISGEFVGILGANGAGKSTLLKTINGLVLAASGSVETFGVVVSSRSACRLRKQIGYVAQEQSIDPRLPITVVESVLVGTYGRLGFFRFPDKELRKKVDETLELVGIAHLRDKPLGHLSGGEKQKTAIARALVQTPRILLLDEPTKSLDMPAQVELRKLIGELHSGLNLTTVMVTHDLNALPEECAKVLFIEAGKIRWQGRTEELFEEKRISELYKTSVCVVQDGGRKYICV